MTVGMHVMYGSLQRQLWVVGLFSRTFFLVSLTTTCAKGKHTLSIPLSLSRSHAQTQKHIRAHRHTQTRAHTQTHTLFQNTHTHLLPPSPDYSHVEEIVCVTCVCVNEQRLLSKQSVPPTHTHINTHTHMNTHKNPHAHTHKLPHTRARSQVWLSCVLGVCVCVCCVCMLCEHTGGTRVEWSVVIHKHQHSHTHTHTVTGLITMCTVRGCVCVVCVCMCEHTGGTGGKRSVVRACGGGGNRCGRRVLTWYIQKVVFFRYCVEGHGSNDMAAGVCVCV